MRCPENQKKAVDVGAEQRVVEGAISGKAAYRVVMQEEVSRNKGSKARDHGTCFYASPQALGFPEGNKPCRKEQEEYVERTFDERA
ncbi:hypothetical protein D3C78_1668160 [compost metagenome]